MATRRSDGGRTLIRHAGRHPAPMSSLPSTLRRVNGCGALRWRTWGCIVALPALLLAVLIATYSVDLPSYDQWIAIAPLLEKMGDGTLRLDDVLALHNEHRIVVPRLIFLPLAVLTHWNTQAEMALVWLALLGMAANWWGLLRATGFQSRSATHGLFAVMALLVFHTLQFENVLSGFQLHFILPILFASAGLWAAHAQPAPRSLVSAMLLATLATFSSAQGLLCWPLFLPVLWINARRGVWKWWLVYAVVAAANFALYFRGYVRVAKHAASPDMGEFLCYAMVYLGAPFADGQMLRILAQAQWCGGILLALTSAMAWLVWRKRGDRVLMQRALPWLMVGLFALGTTVLTASGRAGFGAAQAFETRYTTYAVLLPIALLPLGALLLAERPQSRTAPAVRWGVTGGGMCLLVLHVAAQSARLPVWSEHRQQRLMVKAALQTMHLGRERAWASVVSPEPARLASSAAALRKLGYLRITPIEGSQISAMGDPKSPGDKHCGRLFQPDPGAGLGSFVGGWAVLPWRHEAADAVLLTYDDRHGEPTIFEVTLARASSRHALEATGDFDLLDSGWRVDLNATRLPESARVVKAWAYDAESGRAWRLAGQTTIER